MKYETIEVDGTTIHVRRSCVRVQECGRTVRAERVRLVGPTVGPSMLAFDGEPGTVPLVAPATRDAFEAHARRVEGAALLPLGLIGAYIVHVQGDPRNGGRNSWSEGTYERTLDRRGAS